MPVLGIRVAETPGADQAIARVPTAVTAFVGRTLRGPVNRAVAIDSFADYQSMFGGLWQPSTLSYAVEQYFENGGQRALIVRVTNGGRAPSISLRAGTGMLILQALQPGTREFLRASVDYDGIGDNETDRFNLVVQRVRAPGSEYVEDQEIYRRLSVLPEAQRFVTESLAQSSLVRVVGEVPAERPEATLRHDTRGVMVAYTPSNPDGNDGAPLSDYDVIGSAVNHTGLFALDGSEGFNFLCIPPLGRDTDVGPGVLFVAARFCRARQAMLVVDPPAAWDSATTALRQMREWSFFSENALMYFPRMLGYDRLRGKFEYFAPCGAVAGMLARMDAASPPWSPAQGEEPVLRLGFRPACAVSDAEKQRLVQQGVNVLQAIRPNDKQDLGARTLAGGNSGAPDWKFLSARRLALFILSSIEQGTRWAVFQTNTPALRRRLAFQVEEFLADLDREGAFTGHDSEESYFAVCDERLNGVEEIREGVVKLLFGFAAQRSGEYHAYVLTQRPGGSELRPVSLNRLETGGRKLEEEMQSGIFERPFFLRSFP